MSGNSRFAYTNPDAGRYEIHDTRMRELFKKDQVLINKKQEYTSEGSQIIEELMALADQPDQLKSPEILQDFLKIMI